MAERRFSISESNADVIFHDRSPSTSEEFKSKLMNLVIRILKSEEIVIHLREINIYLFDSGIKRSSVQRFAKRGEVRFYYDRNLKPPGIKVHADFCYEIYIALGIARLYKRLSPAMTHELVHYLHDSINARIERISRASAILKSKYEREVEEFRRTHGAKDILDFLNTFTSKCIMEGFAEFFQALKHGNLRFTQPVFEELYAKAIKSAKVLLLKIEQLQGIPKSKLEQKFDEFKILESGESHWYMIGSHIIYSIVYLQREEIGTEIKLLLEKFSSFFGKLHPKKVIVIYDNLMRSHHLQPVITYKSSGGYINIKEVGKVLRSVFPH